MAAQASLVYQADDGSKQDIALDKKSKATIGRHPQCTLFVNQPSVSRRHARVWFETGAWYVEDLKSSNGTFVNNQRVEKESLNEGDEVRCGDFKVTFLVEEFTREVSDIIETPPAPRLVGTIDDLDPRPEPDPKVISRPTIGVQDAFGIDETPGAKSNPPTIEPRSADDGKLNALRDELASALKRVDALEQQNRLLNSKEVDFVREQNEQLDKVKDAEKQVAHFERKVEDLEQEVGQLKAKADSNTSSVDDFVDEIAEACDDLDAFTSEVHLKLRVSSAFLDDIDSIVTFVESLRNDPGLDGELKKTVQAFVDGADGLNAVATIKSAFNEAQKSTRASRRLVRLLREIIRPHIAN
ncbi:MAG: hypothetical protein CMH52_01740 [Myxococcales bacterium]|mgnify:CR=1 FL=1|nr:hypothetical protein [Myxococcales bacterium]|tara:strand:- start:840 stop:1904 length:1065 start_codon:yes stop_codon:yes gene_type:complete